MRSRWIVVILIATQSVSCDLVNVTDPEAEVDALPAVLSTSTDYTAADLRASVPDTALLSEFADAYAHRYSPKLKQALVDFIFTEATELHLNDRQLRGSLEATGQLTDSIISLPYRVEYARFESQRAWIFEFACGTDTAYSEYRCYVISSVRQDTLLFLSGR